MCQIWFTFQSFTWLKDPAWNYPKIFVYTVKDEILVWLLTFKIIPKIVSLFNYELWNVSEILHWENVIN